MKQFKCVAIESRHRIGSENKISLLITYTTNMFPGEYTQSVFDNYSSNLIVDDQHVDLQLWDVSCDHESKKIAWDIIPTDMSFLEYIH